MKWGLTMVGESDEVRFRSFAERYVLARAHKFDDKEPRKGAWLATQDAMAIYGHIATVARQKFNPPMTPQFDPPMTPQQNVPWPNLSTDEAAFLETLVSKGMAPSDAIRAVRRVWR